MKPHHDHHLSTLVGEKGVVLEGVSPIFVVFSSSMAHRFQVDG